MLGQSLDKHLECKFPAAPNVDPVSAFSLGCARLQSGVLCILSFPFLAPALGCWLLVVMGRFSVVTRNKVMIQNDGNCSFETVFQHRVLVAGIIFWLPLSSKTARFTPIGRNGPVLPSLHLCINPAEVAISELSFPNFKISFQSQTSAFGKHNKSKMPEK